MNQDVQDHGTSDEGVVNHPAWEQVSTVISTCATGGTGRALNTAPGWADQLRAAVSGATRLWVNEPLAKRTTLRVGGPADLLVEPACEADLAVVLRMAATQKIPVFMLGRGSNLLVRDRGIRGIVITLASTEFSKIEVEGEEIRAGAGARLNQVAHAARRANLAGFEFFEGIPGSVGGALRMNAGAMGSATFDRLLTLRAMDSTGEARVWNVNEVPVNYRCCPLLKSHVALGAVFRGQPDSSDQIQSRMQSMNRKRWESQPSHASAGCIFKNPGPSLSAGRLIDESGLKRSTVGHAAVSDEHANFIVNRGGATAREVLELIEHVRDSVARQRGISLETEVEIVGDDG